VASDRAAAREVGHPTIWHSANSQCISALKPAALARDARFAKPVSRSAFTT